MTADVLHQIQNSLQLLARLHAAQLLDKELSTAKLEQIYALTGDLSPDDIAKKLRLSKSTITATHARWLRMGLLQKDGDELHKTFS